MTTSLTESRVENALDTSPLHLAVDDVADQLASSITGDFDFVVKNASSDKAVQKLIIMVNFMLETIRQAINDKDAQKRRELENLVADLQSAMLFKDQFLATMSHELRTPLNAIIGYSGMALSEDYPEDVEHLFDRIRVNAMRQLSLINDILDISRINAKRLEILSVKVALHELIKGWYGDFKKQADDKGIELVLELDSSLPLEIKHDPDRLTQIASNLLTNAIKFTDKGTIKLTTKRLNNDHWMISVSDTGAGIPETWQQVIFDEFRQVDGTSSRKHGGAGLGLSIVQKLCLLMSGSIRVESKVGTGSTFIASLPLQTQTSRPNKS